jgi:CheY-like chemotaxis protein
MACAMKENPALRDIPIIMMSAVNEGRIRERFDAYDAFLRKPFRVATLIEAVHKVLRTPA